MSQVGVEARFITLEQSRFNSSPLLPKISGVLAGSYKEIFLGMPHIMNGATRFDCLVSPEDEVIAVGSSKGNRLYTLAVAQEYQGRRFAEQLLEGIIERLGEDLWMTASIDSPVMLRVLGRSSGLTLIRSVEEVEGRMKRTTAVPSGSVVTMHMVAATGTTLGKYLASDETEFPAYSCNTSIHGPNYRQFAFAAR